MWETGDLWETGGGNARVFTCDIGSGGSGGTADDGADADDRAEH